MRSKTDTAGMPSMKPCVVCYSRIPASAKTCEKCHSKQTAAKCLVCGHSMSKDAFRCKECGTIRGWRGIVRFSFTSLPLVTSLFAVISSLVAGAAYIHNLDSHTHFKVISSSTKSVNVKVWNTGRAPSTLLAYRLIFEGLPIETAPLELAHDESDAAANVILPLDKPVKLELTIGRLELYRPGHPKEHYVLEDVKRLLKNKPVKLEIDVEESNDPSNFILWKRRFHTRDDEFPADRIVEFINTSM